MADGLATRNVFLDTEVFIGQNFSYANKVLARLAELGRSEKISLFVTDIVTREVESNIVKRTSAARNYLKKVVSKHESMQILRNLKEEAFAWPFRIIDSKQVSSLLIEQFREYLKSGDVEVIPTEEVSVAQILDDYFRGRAPFGRDRKPEFPDAITIAALKNKSRALSAQDFESDFYVISNNASDFADACVPASGLHFLSKVEEFLNIFALAENELSKAVLEAVSERFDELVPRIEESFQLFEFSLDEVPWEYSEVSAIDVDNVGMLEALLVDVHDTYAILEITAIVDYTAHVEYPDPDWSVYDSESGEIWYDELIANELTREAKVSIELAIEFDKENIRGFTVDDLQVASGGRIVVRIRDG